MTNEAVILTEDLPDPGASEPSTCGDCEGDYPTNEGVSIQAPINETWRGLNSRECLPCAEEYMPDMVGFLRSGEDCEHYDEAHADDEEYTSKMFAVYGLGTMSFVCEPCADMERPTFPD